MDVEPGALTSPSRSAPCRDTSCGRVRPCRDGRIRAHGGGRAADTAAHLVDEVLPHVPMRQGVLAMQPELHLRVARDPAQRGRCCACPARSWRSCAERRRGAGRAGEAATSRSCSTTLPARLRAPDVRSVRGHEHVRERVKNSIGCSPFGTREPVRRRRAWGGPSSGARLLRFWRSISNVCAHERRA